MSTCHRLHCLFQVGIHIRVVQNGFGVHSDVVVDDELQPRQAHTFVRQLAKVESQLGVAHVHHDLHRNLRHHTALYFRDFCLQQSIVDKAGITLCTAYGDQHPLFEKVGGVAATHHGRDAQLAGNDGGVASAPPPVGHNCAGPLHHRLPIGVRHVGNEHIARLHPVHLADVVNNPHRPGSDLLTDGTAFGHHIALTFELVAVLSGCTGLAFHSFRARLQDIQLTVDAIFAPFDVHRTAVMLFNHQGVLGQLLHIRICQGVAVTQFCRHVGGLDQPTPGCLFFGTGEHHLQEFGAQIAANDGTITRFEHGLVDIELVRVHSTLNHGFTQAVAGGDKHHLIKAGFCVDSEHHTRRAQV